MDHHSHSYRSRSNQIIIHEYMWLPLDQYPGGGCTSSTFLKLYPLTLAVLQSIELTHSANMIWQDDMWLILLQVSMRFIRFIKSCTKQSIVDACKHACTRATIQFRYLLRRKHTVLLDDGVHLHVYWWRRIQGIVSSLSEHLRCSHESIFWRTKGIFACLTEKLKSSQLFVQSYYYFLILPFRYVINCMKQASDPRSDCWILAFVNDDVVFRRASYSSVWSSDES